MDKTPRVRDKCPQLHSSCQTKSQRGNDGREESGVTGTEDIAESVLTDGLLSTPVGTSDPHTSGLSWQFFYQFLVRTFLNSSQHIFHRTPQVWEACDFVNTPLPPTPNDTGHLQTSEELGIWIPSTWWCWTKPAWSSSWLGSVQKHSPIISANALGQIELLYRLSVKIVESMSYRISVMKSSHNGPVEGTRSLNSGKSINYCIWFLICKMRRAIAFYSLEWFFGCGVSKSILKL